MKEYYQKLTQLSIVHLFALSALLFEFLTNGNKKYTVEGISMVHQKRVFVYRNQREKELGPCSKTRGSPCAIALFLLNMIE